MAQNKSSGPLKFFFLIILIILLNVVSFRYNQWYDLTRARAHSLSPHTIDALNKLKEPVQILCFFRADDNRWEKAKSYLERMQSYSNLVTYQLYDPDIKFDLMQAYDLQQYGMIFISGSNTYSVYDIDEPSITLALTKIAHQKLDTSELISEVVADPSVKPLNLNFLQVSFVLFMSVIVIPLIFVAIGLVVWWQRR
ncbi:MAG: Gldg family protein [Anaerolineae bacterium]|nr:Gldg family protein [Anaerolineae bacterium]